MISKGTQYLTAAGFGNIRVTAASMGPLDILGTCWLRDATQQAIKVAFGADGAAVINATNAYLNGIAATDRSKAQRIADWLNTYAIEDAKIVYSLVEGIGTRWICGKGQLDTGVIPTANTTFIDRFKPLTGISEWIVTSNYTTWANNTTGYVQNSSAVQWFIGGTGTTSGNGYYRTTQMIIDRKVVVEKTKTKYIYDGTDIPTGNGGNYNTSQLYARTADNLYRERLQIAENGVVVRDYVPFKLGVARTASQVSTGVAQSAGTLGMLDMVTGIFYPNTASGGSYSELIETPNHPLTPPKAQATQKSKAYE